MARRRGELTDPIDIDALVATGDELPEAYQIGRAIMMLARNQTPIGVEPSVCVPEAAPLAAGTLSPRRCLFSFLLLLCRPAHGRHYLPTRAGLAHHSADAECRQRL